MLNLNSDNRNINNEAKTQLPPILSKSVSIPKCVHFFGIKVFNSLPQRPKKATGNIKQFKTALKCYLLTHSFYSTDEYFNVNKQ
jgi:hypothetical protein